MSTQLRPGALYAGIRPIRDPKYVRFVKRFACIGCGATWGIDPMHTGPHGLGQKASDKDVLPGCRSCHNEFDANPAAFAVKHGLDIPALILKFNSCYEKRPAA